MGVPPKSTFALAFGQAIIPFLCPEFQQPANMLVGGFALLIDRLETSNALRFEQKIEIRFKEQEAKFVDWDSIKSQKFIESFIDITKIAQKTLSDQKLEFLANAVFNLANTGLENFTNLPLLIRLLDQVSDGELLVLSIFHRLQIQSNPTPMSFSQTEVADKLSLSQEDISITCLGLQQLKLIDEGVSEDFVDVFQKSLDGVWPNNKSFEHEALWSITSLGQKLISLSISKTPDI